VKLDNALPVVVIGAGPVGLAAAAHLRARGMLPLVLEAGHHAGAAVRRWAHVRMFSPWAYNVDREAARLLEAHGWQAPDPGTFPTGAELADAYLAPLAALPEIAPLLRFGARVTAVTRLGRDRMKDADRARQPFLVRFEADGVEQEVLARAVIDASGTLASPNPLGAAGIPALGEGAASARISYGIPDVLGAARERFLGKRVMVVGSGHSAFNVLSDLARLRLDDPTLHIAWAVRRPTLQRVLGGGENDQLEARGRLGLRIAALVESGVVALHTGVSVDRVIPRETGVTVASGGRALPEVDELIAATGFRPDLGMLGELRLELDPGTQSPVALGPLIDPNLHSCGTVRPHGAAELGHPEGDLYVVGMKSYGRAPTFLLLTGYEQVRSVAAALAGDMEAARRVELVLPETGVCRTQFDDDPVAVVSPPVRCGEDRRCDAVATPAAARGDRASRSATCC
jgi:hypothetical protein